ncbi:hypothetical protein AGMMS4956_00590 [Bacteroidia bacterium]|nr:hypothetical protein AGMMS4956_00590 [Bacteroidia bacterium]
MTKISTLCRVLRGITNHPLNRSKKLNAVERFARWQLGYRLNPYPIIYPFTNRSKLVVEKGMAGATGNLYSGLSEYEGMSFLLHFLRANDLFVDAGANVGSFTVLAAAHVGAHTISIEPSPLTYVKLMNNVRINNVQDKVNAHQVALGEKVSIQGHYL